MAAGLALLWVLAGCAPMVPPTAEPPRQLLPSPEMVIPAEREVMVMVPLADAATLEALTEAFLAEYPVTLVALWPMTAIDLYCIVFEVDGELETAAVMADFAADPRVSIAQPMNLFATRDHGYDDPLLDLQSGLQATGAVAAHAVATGEGVRVAVIDTGIDRNHRDLQGQLERLADLTTQARGVPPERHGTAVAGVIGAVAGNGQGIVGVAPRARLWGLRGCWELDADGRGRCSSFTLARSLNFALVNGADVINLSLGGPYDPVVDRLIGAALDRGVPVVAALEPGADGKFPATVEGVIAVRSAGPGPTALADVLVAPGRGVLSTAPDDRYAFFDGASMATAHVTGLVALLRHWAPDAPPAALAAALASDAVPDACTAIARLAAAGYAGGQLCPSVAG